MQQASRPFHIMAKGIGPLCNLRCDYCFYLDKKEMFSSGSQEASRFVMTGEVLEAFVKGYMESQPEGTGEIHFTWQGGEPTLLPLDFFRSALALQKKYRRPGMKVTNSLQTNGTLLDDEKARFFRDSGFLVGISIDGPEELHDAYRRDAVGNGSFRRTMQGLEILRKHGVEFNTLTVVQNLNSRQPETVYRFLKETGSRYLQFIPAVEPVYNPGPGHLSGRPDFPGPEFLPGRVSGRSVVPEDWGNFLIRVFRIWAAADIGKVFVQHFDDFLGQYLGWPSSLCVHSSRCGNALAVEHDGGLYSCDHYVFPENYLGNLINEGIPVLLSRELQETFSRAKSAALTAECRACPYLNLCRGGCLKDRIQKTADGYQNYLCRGYLGFFRFSEMYFRAMGAALSGKRLASDFREFLPPLAPLNPQRNDPCPCLSGRKYKNCCG